MKYTREELKRIKRKIFDNPELDLYFVYTSPDSRKFTVPIDHFYLHPQLGICYSFKLDPDLHGHIRAGEDGLFDFGAKFKDGNFEFKAFTKVPRRNDKEEVGIEDVLEDSWERGYYTREQINIIKKEVFDSPYFNLYIKYWDDWERDWNTRSVSLFKLEEESVEVGNGRNYSQGKFNTEDYLSLNYSSTFFITSKITNEKIPLYYFFDPEYRWELSKHKYVKLSDVVKEVPLDLDECDECVGYKNCKASYYSIGGTDCKNALTKYFEDLYGI